MKEKQVETKKKSLSAIAKEVEDEYYNASDIDGARGDKPIVSDRTLIRNFKAVLATLNVEKDRFKDSEGNYLINKGTEPLMKAFLKETRIKGSYFFYAKQNRAKEASHEEIIATYIRVKEAIIDQVDEKRLQVMLKVLDKAIGYSYAVEQKTIQEAYADIISNLESLEYPNKVKALRKLRKQLVPLFEETKSSIVKQIEAKEKEEAPGI
ncbi:hypothetical protein MHB40_03180 [Lysinibacillus sp. FSL K6-0057]|uniref:hypothetical protein n=1 Tax=Lysinibacillus sp. FSL K6-0057 TaxID=2921411 RepID=UPI00315AAD1D